MSRVEIVMAEAFDAEAILSIYAPYVLTTPVTFETEVPSVSAFAQRIEDVSGAFPYLLLFLDSELVGYAYAHKQRERAAFGWNAELSVYLRMDMRGRGMGRPLYQLLIDLLAMQGYVNVYGVITGSNAGSIALHEKMGFTNAGVHEKTGFKFGEWHDIVWMHKRIDGEGEPRAIVRFDAVDCAHVDAMVAKACAEIKERLKKAQPQSSADGILSPINQIQ